MRQLLPEPAAIADTAAHEASLARPAPAGRPWLLCNMISSADGAITVDGVSGPLGGPADKALFRALRSIADVILVGAGTVRAERYRVPRIDDELVAARRARGQDDRPRLAVVTASGELSPSLGLFQDPDERPYVVTTASLPAAHRRALEDHADLLVAGADQVDLGRALASLGDRGARVVLCEGGPSLNGQLLAQDLVDEWRLTLSPVLAAGDARRAATGPAPSPPHRFTLDRLMVGDDLVFLRYLRR